MSLVNDYLKKIGNRHKASVSRDGRGVPPILQRLQRSSSRLLTKKKLLWYGGGTVLLYCVGYFMISAVNLARHPGDATVGSFDDQSQAYFSAHKQLTAASAPVSRDEQPRKIKNSEKSRKNSVSTLQGNAAVSVAGKKATLPDEREKEPLSDVTPNSTPFRAQKQPDAAGIVDQQEPYPIIQNVDDLSESSESQPSPSPKSHRPVVFTESKNQSAYFYQIALQAQHDRDFGRAERYYQAVLKEEPNHINTLVNLSALYIQEQRFKEAQSLLDHLFSLSPENPKALVNAGMIALQNHKPEEAEKFFRHALQRNPVEKTALLNLSYLAQQNKKYDEAEGYFKKLVYISPDDNKILLAYAGLEEKRKRYIQAIILYRQSLKNLNMQQNEEQYTRIKQRIQVLRQYVSRQAQKNFFKTHK